MKPRFLFWCIYVSNFKLNYIIYWILSSFCWSRQYFRGDGVGNRDGYNFAINKHNKTCKKNKQKSQYDEAEINVVYYIRDGELAECKTQIEIQLTTHFILTTYITQYTYVCTNLITTYSAILSY